MSDSDLVQFPRGQLSLGAGDLVQVTNVSVSFTNNGKLVHTLKRTPHGKVLGNEEVTGSFDAVIDEDGPERDYFVRVQSGKAVEMRLKIPQVTKNITGFLISLDIDVPLDDVVGFTVNFAGKFTD